MGFSLPRSSFGCMDLTRNRQVVGVFVLFDEPFSSYTPGPCLCIPLASLVSGNRHSPLAERRQTGATVRMVSTQNASNLHPSETPRPVIFISWNSSHALCLHRWGKHMRGLSVICYTDSSSVLSWLHKFSGPDTALPLLKHIHLLLV